MTTLLTRVPRRPAVVTMILAAATLVVACAGKDAEEGTDAARTEAVARGSAAADGIGVTTRAEPVNIELDSSALPAPDPCPPDGLWHPCTVEARLGQSGLAPRLVEEDSGVVRERPLTVPGTAFTVGRGQLVLFYYPDRAARERDQARLDKSRFVTWPRDPSARGQRTLIVSENLLAMLESSSSVQRERINNALTAGPPQR